MDSHSIEASAINAVENSSMSPESFSSGDKAGAVACEPGSLLELVRKSFAIMLL
jgi:hypothetical protein